MATVTAPPDKLIGEQRLLLTGISWDFYQAFGREIEDRPIRLSYDRGSLEISTTSFLHEFFKTMLAKLIELLVLELNIPVRSGGSMTFQRKDLQKGFEPDDCWWIEHESAVRGKRKFDFFHDPSPDLAIEIEISSSLVNRIGIYAALGVREIWRHDGETLRFCVLEHGSYRDCPTSLAFPFLKPEHVAPYLPLSDETDETTLMRQFRDWLRLQPLD